MTEFRAFVDPVLGFAGPPLVLPRPEGATLSDIIALVTLPDEALRPLLRVKLGGEIIDPALYHRVLPKTDAFLTVVLPVQRGGNNLLGTIAAIALVGASLFVGGFGVPFLGAAFAAGSTGASLVAGGLSIGASLLLQGLNAPQQAGQQSASAAKEIGVASAQNAFEPGAYLQRVLGVRKVFPQMVMPPYTELDGDDQIVAAVYGLAGAHRLSDIKIGTAAIADAEDVSYEVREGFSTDAALTLVTDTRIEQGLNLKLSQFRLEQDTSGTFFLDTTVSPFVPLWHRIETKPSPDKAIVFVSLDQGLVWLKGSTGADPAVTALRFRIRRKGTTTWSNLPEFVVRGQKVSGAMRLEVDFEWRPSADMPGSVTAFTAGYGGFSWKFDSVTESGATHWQADSYYASNAVDFISSRRVAVYLDTASWPIDSYEIEMKRGQVCPDVGFSVDSSTQYTIGTGGGIGHDFCGYTFSGSDARVTYRQDDFAHQISVLALQSVWNEYPFDLTNQPTALIAIRARNRSLEQVSCLAAGYVEDWDGSDWVADRVSSNPAAWYREVLKGDLNAEPVADSLIDEAELEDWWQECFDHGYEVNAIVQGQPVADVLSLCAQAGFARPRYGTTHGAVFDGTKSPVGLITQRNASGFSFEKPFGRLPHALKVNLSDETNDYEVRELIVYADGYNADGSGGLIEASRFESITYAGITNEAQARARATRDLRFERHRSRLIHFTMDIEHLEHQLGDLVFLETDILGQIGGRGRVASIETSGGLITSLTLDEERDFTAADAAGATRGVAIRLMDGTVRTEAVTSDDSDLSRVVFATPFAMPISGGDDLIIAGCVVATGTLGSEARKVLLWDFAPGPDLTAQLTALDYAEAQMFDHLLTEDGDHLLTEDGGFIELTETDIGARIVLEDGAYLRLESGSFLLGEI